VADSGGSIFLEQHFEQRGQQKHFRWEIPYQYIVRLEEKAEAEMTSAGRAASAAAPDAKTKGPSTAVAGAAGGAPTLLSVRNRPKTA